MLPTFPAEDVDKFEAGLAEYAGGGAAAGGAGFENSELICCGFACDGSGDLGMGEATLASLGGLGGASSFAASTTGARALGLGVETLFGPAAAAFGAGRV